MNFNTGTQRGCSERSLLAPGANATIPAIIGVKQLSIWTRKVKLGVNKAALLPPIPLSGIFVQKKGTPAVPPAVSLRDAPTDLERFDAIIYQSVIRANPLRSTLVIIIMTDSEFNRRPGGYRFPAFTSPAHTWSSVVQEWADRKRIHIDFRIYESGPPHALTFTAIPSINGVLHPEYQGVGSNVRVAKNQASERIGHSGHCIVLTITSNFPIIALSAFFLLPSVNLVKPIDPRFVHFRLTSSDPIIALTPTHVCTALARMDRSSGDLRYASGVHKLDTRLLSDLFPRERRCDDI
ncbi:hypothetical protein RHS03_01430, partial [Rhizoctonia solani]